ncbi:binding-protein-dependent transport systems inner membrane component [Caballeronia terrestris]|jgi:multiple sugar transport system permease protein|uniref:Binding-protein-dependent transport systems inner membrane component n=1 Tax=Caballeronia terrestris TaxID=1226301 RepID=A0A158K9Q9_9BURK|nr:sugar ABC transporter permease [Caballeronia terrestris]SAL77765.1 binding-protein-dependent transport systems inner membrane component [Caballeronia terrestris]
MQSSSQASSAGAPRRAWRRSSVSNWLDRQAPYVFVLPTVLVILAFSIFPLVSSAYLSLMRFSLGEGGYELTFVGLRNYVRLFSGTQQFHFVGVFRPPGIASIAVMVVAVLLVAWWFVRYLRGARRSIIGFIGRSISAVLFLALVWLAANTTGNGGALGSLMVTMFYVVFGVALQFLIGLGLAYLCTLPLKGGRFFRLLFFLPLMVTPVGIAYMFRMMADTSVGPLAPLWAALGLGQIAWAADPWLARSVVVIGDTWQWVPFMFLVLLAALEGTSRDQIEAAQLDGASNWRIFRDVTWPSIAPVAASAVLIRLIEAFKVVDLPNVLTNGGPGIATESMTLHAFIEWRTLNLGGASAVAYMLFFVSTIACVSFFQLVVRRARGQAA